MFLSSFRAGLLFLFFGMVACDKNDKITNVTVDDKGLYDLDGDGFYTDEDCDDQNSNIFPGANEICDGIDNDCDAQVDEAVQTTFYLDNDGDGFGDLNHSLKACEIMNGYAPNGNDCNDFDSKIYPSSIEICDNIDNDCNGLIDDGVGNIYYQDLDQDGYGDSDALIQACEEPPLSATNNLDCNDSNEDISPDALEICDQIDNNCDGNIDEEGSVDGAYYYPDLDRDGFGDPQFGSRRCDALEGFVANNLDCDDINTAIHPDALEVCDEVDNDCDSYIDEEDIDIEGGLLHYEDFDGDSFGNVMVSRLLCFEEDGWVLDASDCDDTEAEINVLAQEVCDGDIDNDCDGLADDDDPSVDTSTFSTYYLDYDQDEYGNPAISFMQCSQDSYATNPLDCDDDNEDIHPLTIWYYDADGDGFGVLGNHLQSCLAPANYVDNAQDCDDTNEHAYPNAVWYIDLDGDGFGMPNSSPTYQCLPPVQYSPFDTDCDESDSTVYPNAPQICDDLDHNCDGDVDFDSDGDGYSSRACGGDDCNDSDAYFNPSTVWFYDFDGDGWGDPYLQSQSCEAPEDYVLVGQDCDDQDFDAQPTAAWYADTDGDGYGDPNSSPVYQCLPVSGAVTNDLDCNDADASIYTGHPEVCDDIDHNCDGFIDFDSDGDGYSDGSCGGSDCDDSDAGLIAPNGLLSNCPVLDCDSLLVDFPQTTDGLYWLDPDGTGSFQAYCDMDISNMEGWTLVMRSINVDIPYSALVWTTTALYDENNYDFAQAGYSKYEAFNRVPFSQLRSSYANDWTNHYVENFGLSGYSSALELFSGAGFQVATSSQITSYFIGMITDAYYLPWGCTNHQSYGFNQQAYLSSVNGGAFCDWNGGARWGLRYNASHSSTGNHQGIGWGNYTTIGYPPQPISQLMWVR